jgi:hypothetical protein
MVKGQMAAQDERSSETCLHCEINDVVQNDVAGQEKADLISLAANLEEAGTWYYVVDCATCKAVIPFKHAPENEPIVHFPTMRVRCVHCLTDHTYAADLISHRKAAAPRGVFKRDRPSSNAGDGDREASRDRQEDSDAGDSGERVVLEGEIDSLSSSLRRSNIVIAAVGERRAAIFFLSSCFFAAGWVSQLAMDFFYPIPSAVLNELRSSGPAMLLETAYFGTVLLGMVLFIFGMGSFPVEAFGFQRKPDEFVLRFETGSRPGRGEGDQQDDVGQMDGDCISHLPVRPDQGNRAGTQQMGDAPPTHRADFEVLHPHEHQQQPEHRHDGDR